MIEQLLIVAENISKEDLITVWGAVQTIFAFAYTLVMYLASPYQAQRLDFIGKILNAVGNTPAGILPK